MLQRDNHAHRTAIYRTKPSAPAQALVDAGVITGRVLDYGCGRGRDADSFGWERYDPHYQPIRPTGHFDTILVTYVLNVLPDEKEREYILTDVLSLLRPTASAYITVRMDKANLNGWTSRGTWQGLITLDLPICLRAPHWVTYTLGAKHGLHALRTDQATTDG